MSRYGSVYALTHDVLDVLIGGDPVQLSPNGERPGGRLDRIRARAARESLEDLRFSFIVAGVCDRALWVVDAVEHWEGCAVCAACVAEAEAICEAGEVRVTVEAPDDVVTHYATVRRRDRARGELSAELGI